MDGEQWNSGTKKFAHPQPGIAHFESPNPVSRGECASNCMNGSNCAAEKPATSAQIAVVRQNNRLRETFSRNIRPSHIAAKKSQVKRMSSGAPASICIAPATAARSTALRAEQGWRKGKRE